MQIRTGTALTAALALLIGTGIAQARVGVDEESATGAVLQGTAAPEGAGGSNATAGYDEREGAFIQSQDGDNKLVVGGRISPRFEAISWDDDLNLDTTTSFQVRYARLYFLGNFAGQENTFYMQMGADTPDAYTSTGTSASNFRLLDAWIKHEYSEGFAIKMGQFKVPFSRQNLTSSGKLQLIDRSLATQLLFLDKRDVGIEASGGWDGGRLQYALALVNGDGPNSLNLDDKIGYYGRLSFNPAGDYGYAEGDLGNSETLASTLGVAFNYQQEVPALEGTDLLRFNIDGGVKKGGGSLQGEYYHENLDAPGGDDETFQSFYVQGGWFVRPSKWEIAARVSREMFDADDSDISEYTVGVNMFHMGHRLKCQAAYSYVDYQAGDIGDHRFIYQAQLWF